MFIRLAPDEGINEFFSLVVKDQQYKLFTAVTYSHSKSNCTGYFTKFCRLKLRRANFVMVVNSTRKKVYSIDPGRGGDLNKRWCD
jgi:hypothetical protein